MTLSASSNSVERGYEPRELSDVLEAGLRRELKQPVRIASIDRRPLASHSSHPIDRLLVTFEDGDRLRVIFKRLGPQPEPKGHRREVLIYRRLLAGGQLGAPRLYASVYDARLGRYWLFLEDVGESALTAGDDHDWEAALVWLAAMHGRYWRRERELSALDCLGEQTAAYFFGIADAARRNLVAAGATAALPRFDRLLEPFDELVTALCRQPRTLVHGDVFPLNLMVQPGHVIRAIDWESAAIGVGAWDLCRLLDGWGSDIPAMTARYAAELTRWTPIDWPAFEAAFRRCEILNALWHLGWSVEDCGRPSFVEPLLGEIELSWRSLESTRA